MAITRARVADAVAFGSPRHAGAAAEYHARRVQAPIDSS